MDLEILFKWILESIIYSILGIIVMTASFIILEKVTDFSVKKEIIEDENIALWAMIAGFFIAIGIIIASAII